MCETPFSTRRRYRIGLQGSWLSVSQLSTLTVIWRCMQLLVSCVPAGRSTSVESISKVGEVDVYQIGFQGSWLSVSQLSTLTIIWRCMPLLLSCASAGEVDVYRIGPRAGEVDVYRIGPRAGEVDVYRIGPRAGEVDVYRIGPQGSWLSVSQLSTLTVIWRCMQRLLPQPASPPSRSSLSFVLTFVRADRRSC
jgi:hypothetical protein